MNFVVIPLDISMFEEISEFVDKPPISTFVSPPISNGDSVFANRWSRDQFASLSDFMRFISRFASLMQKLHGKYAAKDYAYWYSENSTFVADVESVSKQFPRTNADASALLDQHFPDITIPWLTPSRRSKTHLIIEGDYFEIFSLGDEGFLNVFVAEDVEDFQRETSPPPQILRVVRPNATRSAFSLSKSGSDKWKQAWKSLCDRVSAHLGSDSPVLFAAFREDDEGIPVDNLDEVAIYDYVVFTAARDERLGGPQSEPFRSKLLDEPTWLDLSAVLHEQIGKTRNTSDVVLEGAEQSGWTNEDGKPAAEYRFQLGKAE